jgi:hypothetical protein
VTWPKTLPANRVAALAAFFSGLGTSIAGLSQVLPSSAANEVAIISGVVIQVGTTITYLFGAQKSEALAAHAADEEVRS